MDEVPLGPSADRPFSCDTCAASFTRKHNLSRHERIHTGDRPFQCRACSSTFTRKANLAEHLRSHVGARPYKCDACDSAFFRRSNLCRHVNRHTESRPFKCALCKYASKTKSGLKIHEKRHSKGWVREYKTRSSAAMDKPLKGRESLLWCDLCSSGFTRKDNLRRHMLIHYNERPFRCESCGSVFSQKSHLTKHMQTHTKTEKTSVDSENPSATSKNSVMPPRTKGERPFACTLCSSSFTHEDLLGRHMSTHREERSFKCETCCSSFTMKEHLASHMLSHVKGENPKTGNGFKIEEENSPANHGIS